MIVEAQATPRLRGGRSSSAWRSVTDKPITTLMPDPLPYHVVRDLGASAL